MFLQVAQRDTWDIAELPRAAARCTTTRSCFSRRCACLCCCASEESRRATTGRRSARTRRRRRRSASTPSAGRCWRWRSQLGDDRRSSGVFFAFYYNNLFPEQVFNISRSIEIILGPIIGGVGTLFGPILGAAVLTLLSATASPTLLAALGWEIPGIKQVFYGVVLLAVIMFLPNGIWPCHSAWSSNDRRATRRRRHQQVLPRPARRCATRPSTMPERRINALIGPNGAGKTHDLQHGRRRLRPTPDDTSSDGKKHPGPAARTRCCARASAAPSRSSSRSPRRSGAHRDRRAARRPRLIRHATSADAAAYPRAAQASPDQRDLPPADSLTLPDRKRLEVARALATAPEAAAARRGDGRAAADRGATRWSSVPARAQRASGPHHPADRARDARGDGARAAEVVVVQPRRDDRARARRQEIARNPAVLDVLSRREEARGLLPAPGQAAWISSTATPRRWPTCRSRSRQARSSRSSAPTARGKTSLIRAIARHRARRAPGIVRFDGHRHHRLAEPSRLQTWASARSPRAARCFPTLTRAREPRDGRHAAARARRGEARRSTRVFAHVPAPRRAPRRSRPARCPAASSRCSPSAAA